MSNLKTKKTETMTYDIDAEYLPQAFKIIADHYEQDVEISFVKMADNPMSKLIIKWEVGDVLESPLGDNRREFWDNIEDAEFAG